MGRPKARSLLANRVFRFVLVIVCAVALRGLFPSADPPPPESIGTVWYTEALWVHNARNKILFDEWQLDPWNPMVLSPPATVFAYLSFSVLGGGIVQTRVVSITLGALSLLLFYAALRRGFGRKAGFLALLLAAGNYFLVMYSKVVMLETIALFFMLVALYCFQRGETHPAYQIAAGAAAALAVITKGVAWVFPLVGIVSLVWLSLQEPLHGRQRLGELRWFLFGVFVTLGAWLFFLMFLYADLLYLPQLFFRERIDHLTWALASPQALVARLLQFPVAHSFFSRIPLLTLLAATGLVTVFAIAVSRARNLSRLEIFLTVWLLGSAIEIIFFEYWLQRRYLFLLPPIIGLSVWALLNLTELRLLERIRALNALYKSILWVSALASSYVLFGSLVRPVGLGARSTTGVALALALLSSAALMVRLQSVTQAMARIGGFRALVPAVVAISLLIDLAQFAAWSVGRSYTVWEVSKRVGTFVPEGASVEGIVAPALAMENRIRPLYPLEGVPISGGVGTLPSPHYLLIHRFSSLDQDETVSEGKKLAEFSLKGFALEGIEGFAPLRSVELYLRHE